MSYGERRKKRSNNAISIERRLKDRGDNDFVAKPGNRLFESINPRFRERRNDIAPLSSLEKQVQAYLDRRVDGKFAQEEEKKKANKDANDAVRALSDDTSPAAAQESEMGRLGLRRDGLLRLVFSGAISWHDFGAARRWQSLWDKSCIQNSCCVDWSEPVSCSYRYQRRGDLADVQFDSILSRNRFRRIYGNEIVLKADTFIFGEDEDIVRATRKGEYDLTFEALSQFFRSEDDASDRPSKPISNAMSALRESISLRPETTSAVRTLQMRRMPERFQRQKRIDHPSR